MRGPHINSQGNRPRELKTTEAFISEISRLAISNLNQGLLDTYLLLTRVLTPTIS
jgi:transcriptional regulator